MLAEGTFDEVMADPAVRDAYLGQMGRGVSTHRCGGAGTDVLSVRNVSAAYGPYRALFDVSFRVPDGGVVALVGSNGAGKSTIARTVTGLVTASVGQVMFSRAGRHRPPGLQDRPARHGHVVEGAASSRA